MRAPWVYRGSDGKLQLYNGVTRATRIAKPSPGTLIRVEVVGNLARQPPPRCKKASNLPADHFPANRCTWQLVWSIAWTDFCLTIIVWLGSRHPWEVLP
jgi:hypothetical protein